MKLLTKTSMTSRYVKPHKKVSRAVSMQDLELVATDAEVMIRMCREQHGVHMAAFAIAHSQINDADPLRFFVLANGMVILNPVITRHTNVPMNKEEGCMSFPDLGKTTLPRYTTIEVEYALLIKLGGRPAFSKKHQEKLKGMEAQIWQHEVDHMNGKYIYKV